MTITHCGHGQPMSPGSTCPDCDIVWAEDMIRYHEEMLVKSRKDLQAAIAHKSARQLENQNAHG